MELSLLQFLTELCATTTTAQACRCVEGRVPLLLLQQQLQQKRPLVTLFVRCGTGSLSGAPVDFLCINDNTSTTTTLSSSTVRALVEEDVVLCCDSSLISSNGIGPMLVALPDISAGRGSGVSGFICVDSVGCVACHQPQQQQQHVGCCHDQCSRRAVVAAAAVVACVLNRIDNCNINNRNKEQYQDAVERCGQLKQQLEGEQTRRQRDQQQHEEQQQQQAKQRQTNERKYNKQNKRHQHEQQQQQQLLAATVADMEQRAREQLMLLTIECEQLQQQQPKQQQQFDELNNKLQRQQKKSANWKQKYEQLQRQQEQQQKLMQQQQEQQAHVEQQLQQQYDRAREAVIALDDAKQQQLQQQLSVQRTYQREQQQQQQQLESLERAHARAVAFTAAWPMFMVSTRQQQLKSFVGVCSDVFRAGDDVMLLMITGTATTPASTDDSGDGQRYLQQLVRLIVGKKRTINITNTTGAPTLQQQPETRTRFPLPLSDSVTSECIRTAAVVTVDDVQSCVRYDPLVDGNLEGNGYTVDSKSVIGGGGARRAKRQYKSIICVPLTNATGAVVGVVRVIRSILATTASAGASDMSVGDASDMSVGDRVVLESFCRLLSLSLYSCDRVAAAKRRLSEAAAAMKHMEGTVRSVADGRHSIEQQLQQQQEQVQQQQQRLKECARSKRELEQQLQLERKHRDKLQSAIAEQTGIQTYALQHEVEWWRSRAQETEQEKQYQQQQQKKKLQEVKKHAKREQHAAVEKLTEDNYLLSQALANNNTDNNNRKNHKRKHKRRQEQQQEQQEQQQGESGDGSSSSDVELVIPAVSTSTPTRGCSANGGHVLSASRANLHSPSGTDSD